MKPMFLLGCAGQGVQPSSIEAPVSEIELPVMEQFRLQKESGLWDFVDRIPASDKELDEYIKASQHYNLPVLTGSWTYTWVSTKTRSRQTSSARAKSMPNSITSWFGPNMRTAIM
jgi:hypothetical protein